MIYTVDRVQFDECGELLFFEFFNREKEDSAFIEKKYLNLSRIPNTHLIGVKYDNNYLVGGKISVVTKESKAEYIWNDYKNWFSNKNSSAKNSVNTYSKILGTATINEGDPYVHDILEKIHRIDFSLDDNGLSITKAALQNESTFGFDFDLFDDEENTIIEFLKNETMEKEKNPINNLKAHPMRYSWISEKEQLKFKESMKVNYPNWKNPRKQDNKKKFISLWNAKEILGGDLYLINYNDKYKGEVLTIIDVIELDVNKGFLSDVSYKVSYNEMVAWLYMMNKAPFQAKEFLSTFPKEVRNKSFWNEYYQNQMEYGSPKRGHIGTNYK